MEYVQDFWILILLIFSVGFVVSVCKVFADKSIPVSDRIAIEDVKNYIKNIDRKHVFSESYYNLVVDVDNLVYGKCPASEKLIRLQTEIFANKLYTRKCWLAEFIEKLDIG